MSSLITIKKESIPLIQEVILRPYIDCCRKRHFLQRRSKWNLVSLYDYTFLDNSTCRVYREYHTVHHKGKLFYKFYDEYTAGLYILHRDVLLYVHEVLFLLI